MINPREHTLPNKSVPTSPRNRRRWIIVIVAGLLILGTTGTVGLWYFTSCGHCGRSPILCDDPCTLPTFG